MFFLHMRYRQELRHVSRHSISKAVSVQKLIKPISLPWEKKPYHQMIGSHTHVTHIIPHIFTTKICSFCICDTDKSYVHVSRHSISKAVSVQKLIKPISLPWEKKPYHQMIGSHTHVTHIIPREKKVVSPNDWLIKLYSEHSVPIVLSSLGSVPQAF